MKKFYAKQLIAAATAAGVLAFGANVLAETNQEAKSDFSSKVVILPTEANLADCAPEVVELISEDTFRTVSFATLKANDPSLTTALENFLAALTAPNYQTLLDAVALAADCDTPVVGGNFANCSARAIVSLPNGRRLIDSNVNNTVLKANNDSIGRNTNTMVSFIDAQQGICGVSAETLFDPTTGNDQNYLAFRIGPWRDNSGSISFSTPA